MSLKFGGFFNSSLLQISLPLELLPLGSLLRERIHPTSTTTILLTLVHYKLCNSTNLVTMTSSSFVTVNLYCWDLVFTTTISVYPTFNNKYFQFYVHCSICCYRHLGRITAIMDSSKLLSFTLNYCFRLLWIIFIYTWLVLPPYNCSYFQVIYFQVTYIIFITILL